MKSHLRGSDGNTMAELVMVMMLIILFSVTICTLIVSGSGVQERINNNKDVQIDARVAMSNINVRIRQNDASGALSIEPHPETGRDSLRVMARGIDSYDIWIYFVPGEDGADGTIYEFWGLAGEEPSVELSTELISVKDFIIAYNEEKNSITNTVRYDYSGEAAELSSTVALRCQPEGGADIVYLE